jgi:hypothetical protein
MVALSVNGIEIPVCTWKESDEEIGERMRASSGKSLVSIRDRKFVRRFSVRTEDTTLAEAIKGLLTGDGFSWSFDIDWYSEQGLPVIATAGAASSSLGSTAPTPAFGAKRLAIPAATTVSWQLPDRYSVVWTMIFWAYYSGAWHHYVLNSLGEKWKDGATTTDSVYVNVVTGGGTTQMQLSSPSGSAAYYDDVVVVPYLWPSTWPAQVYAATRAWKPFPFLSVDGELMPQFGLFTCRGEYHGGPCVNRGRGADRLREMEFTLYED